jgi:hypothetical protein
MGTQRRTCGVWSCLGRPNLGGAERAAIRCHVPSADRSQHLEGTVYERCELFSVIFAGGTQCIATTLWLLTNVSVGGQTSVLASIQRLASCSTYSNDRRSFVYKAQNVDKVLQGTCVVAQHTALDGIAHMWGPRARNPDCPDALSSRLDQPMRLCLDSLDIVGYRRRILLGYPGIRIHPVLIRL